MTNLREFLTSLNSAETQWGVWVNPKSPEDYRVGQLIFDNGGILDDWVFIGNLDSLSRQPLECDIFSEMIGLDGFSARGKEIGTLEYQDKIVSVHGNSFYQAYCDKKLHPEMQKFVESEIQARHEIAVDYEVNQFIDEELPLIIEDFAA